MKYLLTFLLIFVTYKSHACSNWISVSELARSQAGEPAKAGCKEGEKCFCYEGINLKDAKVGMKMVDDKTKPIYEDVIETYDHFIGYEQKEVNDETKPILDADGNITGYEQKLVDDETKPIYEQRERKIGERISGYVQKEVEGLIVDEQKRQARLDKEAQKEAKRLAKEQRKQRREEAKEALLDTLMLDDQGNELTKKEIKKNLDALKKAVKDKKPKK